MTLADSEIEYIEGILGREMNELEEGMLDVMFSEHCSYKSSRPFLRAFPTEGENIILGPGDDAGLVSVTDKYALAVGMESHNHPSAIYRTVRWSGNRYWRNPKGHHFHGSNAYCTSRLLKIRTD